MKLTNKSIDALAYSKTGNKADLYFDSEQRGFGIRVYPSQKKSFFIDYRNKGGTKKRLVLGDYGSLAPQSARKLAQQKLAEVLQGHDPANERREKRLELTFGDLAKHYLESAREHKRSIESDEQRLRDHVLPDLATRKLSEITLRQLERLHRAIKVKTSASTANRCAALFKKMFNDAVKWQMVDKSPGQHVKMFKEPPSRDITLTPEQTERLIDACQQEENPFARALFLLAMFTGRRLGEIRNAKWENLDIQSGRLIIPKTKAGEQQVVILYEVTLEILAATPRIHDNPYIIAGDAPGKPLNCYKRAWKRILKNAEIDHFPPHGLRHNFASSLVARGTALPVVQALLGHKSYLTTLKYAHHNSSTLRDATQKFPNVIPIDKNRFRRTA